MQVYYLFDKSEKKYVDLGFEVDYDDLDDLQEALDKHQIRDMVGAGICEGTLVGAMEMELVINQHGMSVLLKERE